MTNVPNAEGDMEAHRVLHRALDGTAEIVGCAVWLTLALGAGGCQRWRHESEPLPPLPGVGATVRVATRVLESGAAHRYVLRSARLMQGDSLVGIVVEEYQRGGAGRWGFVRQVERGRRVAIVRADVVGVERSEFSARRTVGLALGLVGGLVVVWAIVVASIVAQGGA